MWILAGLASSLANTADNKIEKPNSKDGCQRHTNRKRNNQVVSTGILINIDYTKSNSNLDCAIT